MKNSYFNFYWLLSLFGIGLVLVSYLSLSSLNVADSGRRNLTENSARSLAIVNHLRYLQARENEYALRFVLSGDQTFYDEIQNIREQFKSRTETLLKINPSKDTEGRVANILREKELLSKTAEPILQKRFEGVAIEDIYDEMSVVSRSLSLAVGDSLDSFMSDEVKEFNDERSKVDRSTAWLTKALLASSILVLAGFLMIVVLFMKLEKSRKALLKNSEALAEARKVILETVAHDLKNPLSSIKLSLDLVRDDADQPVHSVTELLEITSRSAVTMERLIADLLDHAKIENGRLVLNTAPCNISDLAQNLTRRFKAEAKSKNIELTIDAPAEPLVADYDEARVDQLLSNLIGNAIKFTPKNGKVRIAVRDVAGEILVSVSDSGEGLSPDEVKHIFERYWQAGKTASRGTGLGLAIAKAIADAHRGKLWVESVKGKGSTFHFSMRRGQLVMSNNSLQPSHSAFS